MRSKQGTNQHTLSKNRAKNFNQKLGQGSAPPSPTLGARLPTPTQYNRNQLNKDFIQFYGNTKLKAHFKNNKTDDEFRVKTNSWTPPSTHPNVLTFIDAMNKDTQNTKPGKQPKDNISNGERIALRNLQIRKYCHHKSRQRRSCRNLGHNRLLEGSVLTTR